ncbi:hypothetical protein [Prosthecomicrobium sp. N25]|uniref:hypothetical protein n=1 Tax=Prosthecomicrobium sp. N25 TaxID=3129254 RepID=UPI003077B4CC
MSAGGQPDASPVAGSDTAPPSLADGFVPLLAAGLTGYYLVSTLDLTWEARSTGTLVGSALLGLCALQFARMVVERSTGVAVPGFGGLFADTPHNRTRLALITALAGFVLLIPWTGTTLGLFLLLLAGMLAMGVRSPLQLFGIAGGVSAFVLILFLGLLKSRLPRGALDSWLLSLPGLLGG